MRVLGVDPSLRSTGWAVLDGDRGRQRVLGYGLIRTSARESLEDALESIASSLEEIILRHQPACLAIEDIYTARNARVALTLGHVRGVVILVCRRHGLPTAEYSATRIKETVAGYGRADKEQVSHMVRRTLSLEDVPPDDASDALAAALTHVFWQGAGVAR